MKKIIVGGGRTGRELASQLPDSVIVEIDPKKAEKLSDMDNVRVIIGDGSDENLLREVGIDDAEAFISLTNNDEINYRSALIAKKHGVPKIIVRVENPEDEERFRELGVQFIMFPTKMVANQIRDLLRYEIKKKKKPFEKIFVPILDENTVDRAFREALLIASVSRAKLIAASSMDIGMKRMERMAREMGVELEVILEREKLIDVIKRHLFYRNCVIAELLEKYLYYPDCIIIDHEELSIIDRLLNRRIVSRLIKSVSCPVLVARTFRYYRKILALIDSSEKSDKIGEISIQIAHLFGSDLFLLILEDISGETMEWIRRTGEEENVQIVEKNVKGNPMIEAVKEVKSQNYDLVVIPWRGSGVVSPDLIRKMIGGVSCSVLTIP
ncbi:MAG: NAD-binding protein [Candidatus Syntropharchaeia archaeon]